MDTLVDYGELNKLNHEIVSLKGQLDSLSKTYNRYIHKPLYSTVFSSNGLHFTVGVYTDFISIEARCPQFMEHYFVILDNDYFKSTIKYSDKNSYFINNLGDLFKLFQDLSKTSIQFYDDISISVQLMKISNKRYVKLSIIEYDNNKVVIQRQIFLESGKLEECDRFKNMSEDKVTIKKNIDSIYSNSLFTQ